MEGPCQFTSRDHKTYHEGDRICATERMDRPKTAKYETDVKGNGTEVRPVDKDVYVGRRVMRRGLGGFEVFC